MPIQFDNSDTGTNAGNVTLKPNASGNWSWTLPAADGTSGQFLTTNGSGSYTWTTTSSLTLTGFTFARNTASPNNVVNVSSVFASGGTTNQMIALVPKGNGGLLGQIPDGTATGGNARGNYTIDFQLGRTSADQVASNCGSMILGGYANKIDYITASSGYNAGGIIVGGQSNQISKGSWNAIVGGLNNSIDGPATTGLYGYNIIINGQGNQVTGNGFGSSFATIVNGKWSSTRSQQGVIVFGSNGFDLGTKGIGPAQVVVHKLWNTTIDAATTKVLTFDSGAASSINTIQLNGTNTCYAFWGYITSGIISAGNSKVWKVVGLVRKAGTSGTVTFVGTPTVTGPFADAGAASWTLSVVANTSNKSVDISVTGQAATTIQWYAVINTMEIAT